MSRKKRIVQPSERAHDLARQSAERRNTLAGPQPTGPPPGRGIDDVVGHAIEVFFEKAVATPAARITLLAGVVVALPIQNLILEPAIGPLGWGRDTFAVTGTGALALFVAFTVAAIVGASGGTRRPRGDAAGARLAELVDSAFGDDRVFIRDVKWSRGGGHPESIELDVPATTPGQAVRALFVALTRGYRLPEPRAGEPRMFWAVGHDSHNDRVVAALEAGVPDKEEWDLEALQREVDACAEETADPWHVIPVGRFSRGESARLKLAAAPHSLITGTTGSGKSTVLEVILAVALMRRWELWLVDPKRQQFSRFARNPRKGIPVAFGYTEGWQALVNAKAEMERRKQRCFELGAEKWQQTGGEIGPLMVIIDEVFALLEEKPEDEDQASLKAEAESALWSIAREGRAPGVHLVLAAQRPDASVIKGEARNNLMTRMLMGSKPAPSSIQMVLPDVPIPRMPLDMTGDGGLGGAESREESSPGIGLVWQDGWRFAEVLRGAILTSQAREAVIEQFTEPAANRAPRRVSIDKGHPPSSDDFFL